MGLMRGMARTAVIAGTASAVSGRVHHRQQQRWAAQEQQQAYQDQLQAQAAQAQAAQMQAPPQAAPAADDTVAQLDRSLVRELPPGLDGCDLPDRRRPRLRPQPLRAASGASAAARRDEHPPRDIS